MGVGKDQGEGRGSRSRVGGLLPGEGKFPETGKRIEMDLATFCCCLETLIPFGSTDHGEERSQRSISSQGALHSSPSLSTGETFQDPKGTVVSTEPWYTIFLI